MDKEQNNENKVLKGGQKQRVQEIWHHQSAGSPELKADEESIDLQSWGLQAPHEELFNKEHGIYLTELLGSYPQIKDTEKVQTLCAVGHRHPTHQEPDEKGE